MHQYPDRKADKNALYDAIVAGSAANPLLYPSGAHESVNVSWFEIPICSKAPPLRREPAATVPKHANNRFSSTTEPASGVAESIFTSCGADSGPMIPRLCPMASV